MVDRSGKMEVKVLDSWKIHLGSIHSNTILAMQNLDGNYKQQQQQGGRLGTS